MKNYLKAVSIMLILLLISFLATKVSQNRIKELDSIQIDTLEQIKEDSFEEIQTHFDTVEVKKWIKQPIIQEQLSYQQEFIRKHGMED